MVGVSVLLFPARGVIMFMLVRIRLMGMLMFMHLSVMLMGMRVTDLVMTMLMLMRNLFHGKFLLHLLICIFYQISAILTRESSPNQDRKAARLAGNQDGLSRPQYPLPPPWHKWSRWMALSPCLINPQPNMCSRRAPFSYNIKSSENEGGII